jgi:hypothetical protein
MGRGSRRVRSKKKRVTRVQAKVMASENKLMPSKSKDFETPTRKLPYRESVIEITPDIAKTFLENNVINREIGWYHVAALQQQMEDGKWEDKIGSYIRFDWYGRLIDGQHRLLACVNSGKSFNTRVIEGLDPQNAEIVDTNRVRNGFDAVAMRQKSRSEDVRRFSKAVATAAMLVKAHDTEESIYAQMRTKVATEVADAVDTYPELFESAEKTKSVQGVLAHSIAIALHFLFSRTKSCAKIADEFFEKVGTGVNCPAKDPALTLRNKLLSYRTGKTKMERNYAIASVIKAWESYTKGSILSKIVLNIDSLPQVKHTYQNRRTTS